VLAREVGELTAIDLGIERSAARPAGGGRRESRRGRTKASATAVIATTRNQKRRGLAAIFAVPRRSRGAACKRRANGLPRQETGACGAIAQPDYPALPKKKARLSPRL
jgi:hypothetical protein